MYTQCQCLAWAVVAKHSCLAAEHVLTYHDWCAFSLEVREQHASCTSHVPTTTGVVDLILNLGEGAYMLL